MGDISKGVQNRSRIASFFEHYSFVYFLEPNHVDEALRDPDWVNAMHEELNNFTRNQVWDLVESPRIIMLLALNGSLEKSKMKMEWL